MKVTLKRVLPISLFLWAIGFTFLIMFNRNTSEFIDAECSFNISNSAAVQETFHDRVTRTSVGDNRNDFRPYQATCCSIPVEMNTKGVIGIISTEIKRRECIKNPDSGPLVDLADTCITYFSGFNEPSLFPCKYKRNFVPESSCFFVSLSQSFTCEDVIVEAEITQLLKLKYVFITFSIIGCMPLVFFVLNILYSKYKRSAPDKWVQMQDTHGLANQATL
jgi:hypothetical protein